MPGSDAAPAAHERLYRVEAPRFVAGLIVRDGRVVRAAPILRWATGRPLDEVRADLEKQGGSVLLVDPVPAETKAKGTQSGLKLVV